MEDYGDKRIIFNSCVWRELEKQNDETVREFINLMVILNDQYESVGGQYPTVDFILGMVQDNIKQKQKQENLEENLEKKSFSEEESLSEDEILTPQQQKEKVRESWLNKFKNKQI